MAYCRHLIFVRYFEILVKSMSNIFTYFTVSLPFSSRDISIAISNLLQTTTARWRHGSHSTQTSLWCVSPPPRPPPGWPFRRLSQMCESRYRPSSRFMLSLVFLINIALLMPLVLQSGSLSINLAPAQSTM